LYRIYVYYVQQGTTTTATPATSAENSKEAAVNNSNTSPQKAPDNSLFVGATLNAGNDSKSADAKAALANANPFAAASGSGLGGLFGPGNALGGLVPGAGEILILSLVPGAGELGPDVDSIKISTLINIILKIII
jgi:hypothetical protein